MLQILLKNNKSVFFFSTGQIITTAISNGMTPYFIIINKGRIFRRQEEVTWGHKVRGQWSTEHVYTTAQPLVSKAKTDQISNYSRHQMMTNLFTCLRLSIIITFNK